MADYFEFEVELTGMKPRIWRRFLVPKDATFLDLHQAIQDACGWLDYHLFNFYGKHPYGESIAGSPDDSGMTEYPIPDASQKKLSSYFGTDKGKKKSCGYIYDFGDDWQHKVKLRKVVKLKDEFPRVLLAGARAFPPEDCGGTWGYESCVEIATGVAEADPGDTYAEEEIESRREWLGDWDPEKFDLEAVKEKFDKGRGAPGGFGPEPDGEAEGVEETDPRDSVPAKMRDRYDEIAGMIESFCREHLNDEYADVCRRMTAALCRKRPSPAARGKAVSWAAGIVQAAGHVNFLFDKSQEPHLCAGDIALGFSVAKSTASAKGTAVTKALDLMPFDPRFCIASLVDGNPLIWILSVNGIMVDVRNMPREVQETAFEKGLIPYIPADRSGE